MGLFTRDEPVLKQKVRSTSQLAITPLGKDYAEKQVKWDTTAAILSTLEDGQATPQDIAEDAYTTVGAICRQAQKLIKKRFIKVVGETNELAEFSR